MATPAATGTDGTTARPATASRLSRTDPSGMGSASVMRTPLKVTAAAYTNHLSCWRSTARERRNRTTSDSTLRIPQTTSRGNATPASVSTSGGSDGPSPAGSSRAGPRSGQAATATGPQKLASGPPGTDPGRVRSA